VEFLSPDLALPETISCFIAQVSKEGIGPSVAASPFKGHRARSSTHCFYACDVGQRREVDYQQ
jgi:hypothetical protein